MHAQVNKISPWGKVLICTHVALLNAGVPKTFGQRAEFVVIGCILN